ncbi:MAG TPA: DUF1501 domain-containing protein [Blastocatellia bacterium]|nr:DUF1501 domain-containing protein [Blastocatellia bacterium]
MPTTRRQFIKLGAGMVTVGMVMPGVWLREARAQSAERRIFVVIQLDGGNDGLNTVIPYTDARYYSLRPALSFKDTELKDAQGNSTIISSEFGLHPELSDIKKLYDQNKVAIVLGVGYPNPNLSHFVSKDIWHTGELTGRAGEGWLGRYADIALVNETGFVAAAIGGLPKSLFAEKAVIPNISNFANYTFQTDPRHAGDKNNKLNTFGKNYSRSFPAGSYLAELTRAGDGAVDGAALVQESVARYASTVTYPGPPNPLAPALKMVAQLATTIPTADLFYVQMGGFDHHSDQIGSQQEPTNKLIGRHVNLLRYFSQAVNAFYADMAEHGLADKTVMMQLSEFGRRPNENASFGTDHGTSNVMFIIGDPVKGGLYGDQPSLEAMQLDDAGNQRFAVDFRQVYATMLDKWLGVDSREVLGSPFGNLSFL